MKYLALLLFASTVLAQVIVNGPATCQQGNNCTYSATGGTPPYTYSLVNGSVGSINPGTGVYTAPPHVVPRQVVNGCQEMPNNSIFNTRIDNLPVHANNYLWMSNITPGAVTFGNGQRLDGSVVLSTDPSVPMYFAYSPPGNFIYQPFPDRLSQFGADWGGSGILPGLDNHFLTTYRDTCQEQDVYKYYQYGASSNYPYTNGGAGAIFPLTTNQVPGYGTDAANLPYGPLILHTSEFLSAASGNLDAFQHAWRLVLDAQSIDSGNWVWPAQNSTSGDFCQGPLAGGFTWNITGNGTTTIAPPAGVGNGFRSKWPAGMTITIDGANYSVVSVAGDGASMVVSAVISAGPHAMTTPETNCAPYGTRFRLKPSYNITTYWPGCTTACQNVVQAILRQQKRYGLILADAGGQWNTDSDGSSFASYDMQYAWLTLSCTMSRCGFPGLVANAENYEIVDESSLQTSKTQGTPVMQWMETKIDNPYVTPDNAAVIRVADSASHTAYLSVALQGVAVGVEHPNEIVMAGAAPFQLKPWVTGSSSTAYTCSLSPSGGANGTITSGCLYTPAPESAVTTLVNTTVTVTAAADSTVTNTILLTIIPLSSDGQLHISLGKPSWTPTYTDNLGIIWWNDMALGQPISFFPDEGYTPPPQVAWSDFPGTNAYAVSSPGIYQMGVMASYNDQHFRIHVPNGVVAGTVLPANLGATSTGIVGFSFDCNGTVATPITDLFTFTGGPYVGRPLTCSQVVNNGVLHMVVRLEGTNLSNYSGCALPCYMPTNPGYGNMVAGLVVKASPAPAYKKVTICAAACDYALTASGLQNALTDAAAYQTSTACIPYIIEGSGTVQTANVVMPKKTCTQYVEIRSSSGAHFTPGQRYNPATDDSYAFGIQATAFGALFYIDSGSRYWRFKNVNLFTSVAPGASYNVTAANWAVGTGFCAYGCETLTIGPHASLLYTSVTINGISPGAYNFGSTIVMDESSTTISVQAATSPGAYVSGGIVQSIKIVAYSSFIQYGDRFDPNVWPDHLEISQSKLCGTGAGDVYKGINNWGSNIWITDSYFCNFSQLGSDSDAIAVYGGHDLKVRNTYLSAIDEDFIAGGVLMAGGVTPTFINFTGNRIAKEPWMNITNGNGAPTKPCFQGNWYHDNAANQDYLCSAVSGVWNLQPTLLIYTHRYPKNVWECKTCQGVRMVGNDLGPMPAQANQDPSFFQLELVTQPTAGCSADCPQPYYMQAQPWTSIGDVLIEGNKLHDGFTPLILGYSYFHPCADGPQPCYNYAHHNITFRNNLITNVSDERNYCNQFNSNGGTCTVAADCGNACGNLGMLRLNDAGFDLDVSHNTQTTSIFSPNSGLTYGVGSIGTGSPTNYGMLSVRDNIFQMGVNGFVGYMQIPGGNGCGLEAMVGPLHGALNLRNNVVTQENPAGQTWSAFQTGVVTPGCTTYNWPADHAGSISWTSILDTGTFKVNNPAYQGWAEDRRDPGADIDLVNWRTAHAVDGTPAPELDFAIRSIVPTMSGAARGVEIHATAIDNSACMWELSTDANLYTSPIAVSAQTRHGRDMVATWNNGALAPGTAYWAQVTCNGYKLETTANGNRAMFITP